MKNKQQISKIIKLILILIINLLIIFVDFEQKLALNKYAKTGII